ncbi:Cys-rich peptide radical SAM maturase CcpM [Ruminococcus flavefaciens]|uniref:Cys-rich peptide radical SAM maturase CcpM n=1 Tax=Ruminococcus flavefaciens TaxID=1265 RepID=UPI0026E9D9B9|nr:Cys-rich peptide radical SAM maturase CcpM [Ruminococcus flavefaciens]
MEERPFIKLLESPLNKYFYDVNRNQLARISDSVYEYLKSGENETEDENVTAEINKLKSKGFLSSYHVERILHPETKKLAFHLGKNIAQVTLQVTQSCNFRCSYCPYTTAEFDSNRSHGTKSMSLETGKKAVDFLLNHSENQNRVAIAFYGGEPLLGFDFIKKIVEYAEEQFVGKELSFTTTTNGSLLTDEIIDYFRDHNFSLMISLDGPREVHNRSRKFAASGKGTFDVIRKNLDMIINNHSDFAEKITLNVVVDPRYSANDVHDIFSNDEVLSRFSVQTSLIDDFMSIEKVNVEDDYIVEDSMHMFRAYAASINRYPQEKTSVVAVNKIGATKALMDIHMKAEQRLPEETAPGGPCVPGQKRLFINVDGYFYPCERVSEVSDAMCIGNINDGFDMEKAAKLLNVGQLTEKKCKNCFAFRHCSLCAKYCDNNGTLSSDLRSSNCQRIQAETIGLLKEYIFLKEIAEECAN